MFEEDGVESDHFGKEQSQMLIAVVWFHLPDLDVSCT
jgi:hypothetical protein